MPPGLRRVEKGIQRGRFRATSTGGQEGYSDEVTLGQQLSETEAEPRGCLVKEHLGAGKHRAKAPRQERAWRAPEEPGGQRG